MYYFIRALTRSQKLVIQNNFYEKPSVLFESSEETFKRVISSSLEK